MIEFYSRRKYQLFNRWKHVFKQVPNSWIEKLHSSYHLTQGRAALTLLRMSNRYSHRLLAVWFSRWERETVRLEMVQS